MQMRRASINRGRSESRSSLKHLLPLPASLRAVSLESRWLDKLLILFQSIRMTLQRVTIARSVKKFTSPLQVNADVSRLIKVAASLCLPPSKVRHTWEIFEARESKDSRIVEFSMVSRWSWRFSRRWKGNGTKRNERNSTGNKKKGWRERTARWMFYWISFSLDPKLRYSPIQREIQLDICHEQRADDECAKTDY